MTRRTNDLVVELLPGNVSPPPRGFGEQVLGLYSMFIAWGAELEAREAHQAPTQPSEIERLPVPLPAAGLVSLSQ